MSSKDKVERQLLPNSVDTLIPGNMPVPVKEESGFRAVRFSLHYVTLLLIRNQT